MIVDPDGRSIPGAELRLYRENASVPSATELSADDGSFRFDELQSGAFLLEAGHAGFRTITLPVTSPQEAELKITLPVAGVSEHVIVTAADQAQTSDQVSKDTTVISHDEIINRNAIALTELLTTTPGVVVRNEGGPGQYTSLGFRGLPSSAGIVLVDGMRLRDASSTQGDSTAFLPALNFIDTDHIEILRGSGSALYGTQAVGGAINIVSNTGGGPTHGDIQIEGGTLGLIRGRASIAGGGFGDRLKYSAGILHLNVMSGVDGQDANRSSGLQGFARYDFTPQISLSGRFWGSDDFVQANNSPTSSGIPFSNIPTTTIVPAIPLSPAGVRTLLAGGTPDFGNATYIPDVNDPDSRISSRFEDAGLIFRDLLSPKASWQASYQVLHNWRSYENGPLGIGYQPAALDYSKYAGTIQTANLSAAGQITPWFNLTGGYEFERENYFDDQDNHLPAPMRIIEKTRIAQNSNSGFFASQLGFFGHRLLISASGRLQAFSVSAPSLDYFGSANPYEGIRVSPPKALTGDISLAYLAHANTKLRAHLGNAYRAPSLYERYGAGFYNDFSTGAPVFSPYGDPRLAPDRYNSVDAGIDQYLLGNRVKVSATFFYTRIVELITFNSNGFNPLTDPFGRSFGYFNGAGGISRGAEVSVEARPMRSFSLNASYTYVNSDTDQDAIVPGFFGAFDLPRHTVGLVATKTWGPRITTTFDYFHYSSYYDGYIGYEQAYRFPGYGKADLTGSYAFWKSDERSARIYARMSNLFDQTYYVVGNLAPRGTAVAGLSYAF
ncbi:MAG TPA: TonB-dependent receptor [Bryobacteraceae bacterium]|jgi:iron complex outermembrane receptor protein|nr:TonB-dependent receptor [Bryobacteraceae bacterium]